MLMGVLVMMFFAGSRLLVELRILDQDLISSLSSCTVTNNSAKKPTQPSEEAAPMSN